VTLEAQNHHLVSSCYSVQATATPSADTLNVCPSGLLCKRLDALSLCVAGWHHRLVDDVVEVLQQQHQQQQQQTSAAASACDDVAHNASAVLD
jgi:hypothetical protein